MVVFLMMSIFVSTWLIGRILTHGLYAITLLGDGLRWYTDILTYWCCCQGTYSGMCSLQVWISGQLIYNTGYCLLIWLLVRVSIGRWVTLYIELWWTWYGTRVSYTHGLRDRYSTTWVVFSRWYYTLILWDYDDPLVWYSWCYAWMVGYSYMLG
jgi:hypothetical protein